MFQIAICDDKPTAAQLISDIVQRVLDQRNIRYGCTVFTESSTLIRHLSEDPAFDVLFTDIDMPGTNGIQLALECRKQCADMILVYVSGREDLVFDTFQAQPFRFIRKRDLAEALPAIMPAVWDEYQHRQNRKMAFRSGADTVLIRPEKVVYIESVLKTQLLHTQDRTYELQSRSSFSMTPPDSEPTRFAYRTAGRQEAYIVK